MTKGIDTPRRKGSATEPRVLGKSALTGRDVLAPAAKRGSASMKDVRTAVRTVTTKSDK